MGKQSYSCITHNSILGPIDDYSFTENEYCSLYDFYVTHSMIQSQSKRSKSFIDYGWQDNRISYDPELTNVLSTILNLNKNAKFIFTEKDDLACRFKSLELSDGIIDNLSYERAVIAHTAADNNYLKLFYRIRDCLAHGKFTLRYAINRTKMVIMEDDDKRSVTARIVIKLETLLSFIQCITIH